MTDSEKLENAIASEDLKSLSRLLEFTHKKEKTLKQFHERQLSEKVASFLSVILDPPGKEELHQNLDREKINGIRESYLSLIQPLFAEDDSLCKILFSDKAKDLKAIQLRRCKTIRSFVNDALADHIDGTLSLKATTNLVANLAAGEVLMNWQDLLEKDPKNLTPEDRLEAQNIFRQRGFTTLKEVERNLEAPSSQVSPRGYGVKLPPIDQVQHTA